MFWILPLQLTSVEKRLLDFISEKRFMFICPPMIPIPPTGGLLLGASSFFSSAAASSDSFSSLSSSFSSKMTSDEVTKKW